MCPDRALLGGVGSPDCVPVPGNWESRSGCNARELETLSRGATGTREIESQILHAGSSGARETTSVVAGSWAVGADA